MKQESLNQESFELKYKEDLPNFENWAEYIKSMLLNDLKKHDKSLSILKSDVKIRIKSIDSLLTKAFLRNKHYQDPYNEITDKVGMRFIVLYLDEVHLIGNLIENNTNWAYSKDKDFLDEIENTPDRFGYESLHYVVTSKSEIAYNDKKIPKGVNCEIQIRTLLQHAFSEMSHSTIYKKNVHNKVKRTTARSMALIESADYFFKEVRDAMLNEEKNYVNLFNDIKEYYSTFAELKYQISINELIIDSLHQLLKNDIFNEIKNFIELKKPFLKKRIKANYEKQLIYRQPVILIVYYFISKNRSKLRNLWPLPEYLLIPLFNDLGYSLGEEN